MPILKSTIDHQPVGQKLAVAARAGLASCKSCVSWAKFPPLSFMFLCSVGAVSPSRPTQIVRVACYGGQARRRPPPYDPMRTMTTPLGVVRDNRHRNPLSAARVGEYRKPPDLSQPTVVRRTAGIGCAGRPARS